MSTFSEFRITCANQPAKEPIKEPVAYTDSDFPNVVLIKELPKFGSAQTKVIDGETVARCKKGELDASLSYLGKVEELEQEFSKCSKQFETEKLNWFKKARAQNLPLTASCKENCLILPEVEAVENYIKLKNIKNTVPLVKELIALKEKEEDQIGLKKEIDKKTKEGQAALVEGLYKNYQWLKKQPSSISSLRAVKNLSFQNDLLVKSYFGSYNNLQKKVNIVRSIK